MFNFIINNYSTILVAFLVFSILIIASIKIIRDKRKGIGSCGSTCANCPSGGGCNPK